MAIKRWNIRGAEKATVDTLVQATGLTPLVCSVLAARGFSDPETVQGFLQPDFVFEDCNIHTDMDKAVLCIREAIESGEKITVFGDYDVDGITATALVHSYLDSVGAQVCAMLPTREGEGYGLGRESVGAMAESGVSLIITVDNGIAAYNEIEYANSLGMRVVVCDHHLPPQRLPKAVAVVNPRRKDDPSGCKYLAGVGVALRLVAAVEGCGVEELLYEYGALVAIGTIADIMPLVGENRALVNAGLERLRECDSPGLCALCAVAGIELSSVDSRAVAFGIAPRLNAAGRIGDAADALRLLLTEDEEEAQVLAEKLDSLNRSRQQIEKEIIADIELKLETQPQLLSAPVLVLQGENYNAGVVGIVASRMVEKYGRPALIVTVQNGEAKGSGRSVEGFSLFDALSACSDVLLKFGGHELAAGFTLKEENMPQFRRLLFEYCKAFGDMPFLAVTADCEVSAQQLTVQSAQQLSVLEPFGCQNEAPLFAIKGARVEGVTSTADGKHSRIKLSSNGVSLSMIMFSVRAASFWFKPSQEVDVLFSVSVFRQNSKEYLSLKLAEIRPAARDEDRTFSSLLLYRRFEYFKEIDSELSLTRADVACVYRVLKENSFPSSDLSALFAQCSISPCKVCAVCKVLLELGLAKEFTVDRTVFIEAVKNPQKRDLEQSETYVLLKVE